MKSISDKLKLTIELVPRTSWYDNLRKCISKSDWNKIRGKTCAEYGHRCGICGVEGRLNCHEIWQYDDKRHIQRLIGFIALCDMCHHVKHLGLSEILASEGNLDYEKVVEHFIKVNKCNRKSFEQHRKRSLDEWRKRSKHEWHVDLGKYENVIQNDFKQKIK